MDQFARVLETHFEGRLSVITTAAPGTIKPNLWSRNRKKAQSKNQETEEVESPAEGTGKLVNQGQTKIPSKETGERVDILHRYSDSNFSSIIKQE